jgi:glyoxylase-like metal-dependent hydrolase (beta-lactamase superfamily II)
MIRRILGSRWGVSAVYLVEHHGVLSLVDTGSPGCAERVVGALGEMGRRPEDLRQIVLTHCHGDHAGDAKRLAELTGATVVAGDADADVIEGNAPYPAPREPISRALYRRFERFSRFPVRRRISGEEDLDGGLRAIPAPGHTLGHIAVFAPDLSALFVGDAVWHLGPLRPSWRRFTQDIERNADSVRHLAGVAADRVLLGHGPSISGDRLRALATNLG